MPKTIDHWSWTKMSFQEWRTVVNDRLLDIYLISIADAGIDDEDLTSHWESEQAPYEFVEWFGLKYDLDPKSSVGL